jgi:hypothetical protein
MQASWLKRKEVLRRWSYEIGAFKVIKDYLVLAKDIVNAFTH